MTPYYERDGLTIYHADARDVLAELPHVDVLLTDPPYGIGASQANHLRSGSKTAFLQTGWDDTPEYVGDICIPIIRKALTIVRHGALTPGYNNMWKYPQPEAVGCFFAPAPVGLSQWGFISFHPIFYYGKNPRAGKGQWPTGMAVNMSDKGIDHPCPKPLNARQWLLAKVSVDETDVILDPFMGSGTTLRAAKNLGRKAIGIEIEERYCEIAANRLSQEVMVLV